MSELALTEPQKVEARKALAGQPYDFIVIREGFEQHEDLLTDADIAFLCASMQGQMEMTPEHSADVRQRMTDAVPMRPGLDAKTLFDRMHRGVKLPKGVIDPYDEEEIVKITDDQIATMTAHAACAYVSWYRLQAIAAGAPETITYDQMKASAGFKDSKTSYVAGWIEAKTKGMG